MSSTKKLKDENSGNGVLDPQVASSATSSSISISMEESNETSSKKRALQAASKEIESDGDLYHLVETVSKKQLSNDKKKKSHGESATSSLDMLAASSLHLPLIQASHITSVIDDSTKEIPETARKLPTIIVPRKTSITLSSNDCNKEEENEDNPMFMADVSSTSDQLMKQLLAMKHKVPTTTKSSPSTAKSRTLTKNKSKTTNKTKLTKSSTRKTSPGKSKKHQLEGTNTASHGVDSLASALLRGVTMRPSGKWQAQLYFAGKSRYIGVFDTREKAASAYEIARLMLKNSEIGREGGSLTPEQTDAAVSAARKAAFEGVKQQEQQNVNSSSSKK